jgi:hypothetical protein
MIIVMIGGKKQTLMCVAIIRPLMLCGVSMSNMVLERFRNDGTYRKMTILTSKVSGTELEIDPMHRIW